MKKIVLASGSPRRKEIMDKLHVPFEIIASSYEEDMSMDLSPEELAIELSLGKAQDVSTKVNNALVIGADTFIFFEGQKLGKPKDDKSASELLHRLSGNSHSVFTGYTVIDTDSHKTVSRAVETKVYFRNLTSEEIDAYIKTGEHKDKAGAYAYQERGAIFVEKIEGDFFNVMGLPLCDLVETLKQFGFTPFS